MSMTEWAEKEIKIACKRENPDWDGESFDYGCACYQSALKAYKSLLKDGHSGYSFNFTKLILIRLMEGNPLTPIIEDDFKDVEPCSLSGNIQCPRMSSLFKSVNEEGNISYHDVNRTYCININNNRNTYSSGESADIVDKLFPITLPYFPQNNKFKMYCEDFLTDKKNGDYDTKGYIYMVTPDYQRIELNIFKAEVDGKWIDISKEEYEERKKHKI